MRVRMFEGDYSFTITELSLIIVPPLPALSMLLPLIPCYAMLISPQYTEEADPELEPMVTSALRFLLSRGRDKDKDKDVNGKSSTSAAADSSSDR